ncbi:MAG: response regulator transcription factor [Actinomycetota bacterium]|nr:response regulator transcription factor [Actinomycetota bacterium]
MTTHELDGVEQIIVAVVEDHPLFRAAVARVLSEVADFTVATTAESVAQFAAARLDPGAVVILDLKLRGVGDAAAVMQVVGMGHRVLVVSAHAGQEEVLGAIGAGAKGYLTKDTDGVEIIRAVREVAAGNSYVTPTLASFLLNASLGRSVGPKLVLSAREREVLSLVAAGEKDQEIAELLHISVRTVRSHLDRIRDKTGLRNRAQLTRYAIEQGIVRELPET